MFHASRLRRIAILSALACTLPATAAAAPPSAGAQCRVQLGAGLPFVPCPDAAPQHKPSPAPAAESSRLKAARAQQRYYAHGETEPATGAELRWAKAQERYYSSYGEPEPINAPIAPAPSDTPWPAIALGAAAALAAASIAAIHRRRLRLRRRVVRAAT